MPEDKGKRLRVSSSIDELPEEAREKLEAMIADTGNGLGYREMAEIMTEDGYPISKSAIGRYARRHFRHIYQMQVAQEQTRIMLQFMQENPNVDVSAHINALIQNGLMWRIVDGQAEIEDMSIEDAIRYSIQAQRAAVYEYRYKDSQIQRVEVDRQQDEAARLEWLREQLRDKPELLQHFEKAVADSRETGGDAVE